LFELAAPADLAAILALQRDYYAADGYPFEAASAEAALARLLASPELGELWVARDGESVVAYVAVTFGYSLEYGGRDAFVDELVVAASHRGRGLGTRALAVADAAARAAGVRALHLEVEHDKPAARRLYERSGFASHSRHLLTKRLG